MRSTRDFINSKANKHGIFLALKFEDKVDRFIRLVSERLFPRFAEKYIDRPLTDDEVLQIGNELVDSILVDIYNEQKVAREAKTWGRSGVRALMPKLNYLAERALNYGVTYHQMQGNQVSLRTAVRPARQHSLHGLKRPNRFGTPLFFPSSFFKRSRSVSKYMVNRCDRILTSIFGRDLSWWDKMSGANDDYDPFGGKKSKSPQGIARQTADKEIATREERLRNDKTQLSQYSVAQNHPGLTYDPELLGKTTRVMTGETYDRLVAMEMQAARHRYETEKAVQEKRSGLLVPLKREDKIEIQSPGVVTTQTN